MQVKHCSSLTCPFQRILFIEWIEWYKCTPQSHKRKVGCWTSLLGYETIEGTKLYHDFLQQEITFTYVNIVQRLTVVVVDVGQ